MERLFPRILLSSPSQYTEEDCACTPDSLWIGLSAAALDETDCACSTSGLEGVGAHPVARWALPPSLYRAPLPEGYQLAFNPVGSAGVVVLNGPAAHLLDSFATPAPLTDPVARQLAALGLLTPHLSRFPFHASRFTFHASRFTSPVLTLWLHLTTRCNLRCAYCYAPRGDVDMSAEVGWAAVDGAIRSAQARGFGTLKIKYAGGEPTLNLPTLRTVHDYAQLRTAEAGLELREVILTNGTMLHSAFLEWIRREGIRLSISLDGIGPSHDQQRVAESGESFASVAAGVDRALAVGLTPHLSITVTARNVDGLAETVAFALERGLPFNLNFVRPVPGQPDLLPEPGRLIAGLRAALAEIEHRLQSAICHLQFAICTLLDRCDLGSPHRYPCGVGHSYLVVGPGGEVAPCHMELQRTVGTIWEDDPLQAVQSAKNHLYNPPVEEKERCRDCLWRYVCAGGCPLTARRLTGREDGPSPYCAVYRAILPDLLRLEGLRLLQQALKTVSSCD